MALHRRPQQQGYQKGREVQKGKGKDYDFEQAGFEPEPKGKGQEPKGKDELKGKGDIAQFVQAAKMRIQNSRGSPYELRGPVPKAARQTPQLRRSLQFNPQDDEAEAEAWACISSFRYIRSCHQDAPSERW